MGDESGRQCDRVRGNGSSLTFVFTDDEGRAWLTMAEAKRRHPALAEERLRTLVKRKWVRTKVKRQGTYILSDDLDTASKDGWNPLHP